MASAKHRDRQFVVNGKAARTAAYANPATRCRDCGRTLADQHADGDTKPGWDYGHPRDNWPDYGIECPRCNRSAGATEGNRNRHGDSLGLASSRPNRTADTLGLALQPGGNANRLHDHSPA